MKLLSGLVVVYLPVPMSVPCLGTSRPLGALSARRGSASASLAQHHADLRIHQQGHDEGHVEGGHRGVDHKGRVGEAARGAFAVGCRREEGREKVFHTTCRSFNGPSLKVR